MGGILKTGFRFGLLLCIFFSSPHNASPLYLNVLSYGEGIFKKKKVSIKTKKGESLTSQIIHCGSTWSIRTQKKI